MHPSIELVLREVDGPGKAVIVTDVAGIILFWNPGAEDLYGWRSDEVMGKDILGVTPSEISAPEAAEIMRSLQVGTPWAGSFVVQAKDGARFLADVTDIPVQDATGRLVGIVGVSRRAVYLDRRMSP